MNSGTNPDLPCADFRRVFGGRNVVVTGHTGFKGSWLSLWLSILGARVTGISNGIPTDPSHFELARLSELLADNRCDLRDADSLSRVICASEPDFVFHLAAQPLVLESYRNPVETFGSNVMGTANLLDALRKLRKACTTIVVTSDKCYDNVEWTWGYRENDRLGGKDPYSASKGAAELVTRGFVHSFFGGDTATIRLAIGRAGNVIGGGDWAPDRLIPDCVRAWSAGKTVTVRNRRATRPWQHVLEPLSGYMILAARLSSDRRFHGEPFNFGPHSDNNHSVGEIIKTMGGIWEQVKWEYESNAAARMYEAGLLKLNCDKALHEIGWKPVLDFQETVTLTTNWYQNFYSNPANDMRKVSMEQIGYYCSRARQRQSAWRDSDEDA